MGRPLYRDVAGTLVAGDYTGAAAGIRVVAYFGGELRSDVYIVKQKGSRSYLCKDKSDNTQAVCKLVSDTPNANGEMSLVGYTAAFEVDANAVVLRKLNKRTAIDYSGNRYTWVLANDSSADYIQLTAIKK